MMWRRLTATVCRRSRRGCIVQESCGRALMTTATASGSSTRADLAGTDRQQQNRSIENPNEQEWTDAKDYSQIPGPSSLGLMREFMWGGEMYGANFLEMYQILRKRYGDIFVLRGSFGKSDMVCTFNPNDFETVYRTEGVWPVRTGLGSIEYYRKVRNPEAYGGLLGLVTAQGESWASIRQKVNPILMKIQTMRQNMPEIDVIAKELVDRIESQRDPNTGLLNVDLIQELRMWSFESICFVALNSRLQLLTKRADENALRMSKVMIDFMQYTFDFDIAPSIWRVYETPAFKRLMRAHDELTEITTNYVDEAMKRIEASAGSKTGETCVLEKLMEIDKKVAIVMAIDMLFGGLDTTSTTVISALYLIAINPEKQSILREELCREMPTPDTPLTVENTKNMSYLRACIKEAMRIKSIVPGTMRHTGRDVILSGYRVPKGTGVHMSNMELCNSDEYFPRSAEYLPERWLKTPQKEECPVQVTKSQNPFVYLPFGFGPRTCIGKRLAEMEMEVLLARLFRRFEISWTDKENGIKFISNLILAPVGEMKFKFELVEK